MWLALALSILTLWDGQHEQWTQQPSSNVVSVPTKPVYAVFWTEPVSEPLWSLTCTFTVQGDETYTFRGENTWNTGPLPANVRFYFSSSTNVYNVPYAGTHPHQFWWSAEWAQIQNGTQTIAAVVSPERWSNALGCWATNCLEGFWGCVSGAKRVGLAYSGGWYFDCGLALTNGSATFEVTDFRVNPTAPMEEP